MKIITGRVVAGKQLGRTLGFPTANVKPDEPFTGEHGVYAADVEINGMAGRFRAMVNIGTHPTFPEGAPTVEAHIFDFSSDIYGRTVTLNLLRYLRPERKFPSAEAFLTQLHTDEKEARNG